MKVKVIEEYCVAHSHGSGCCSYDFEKEVFTAKIDSSTFFPVTVYGKGFPDGSCVFMFNEVEIIEE